MLEPFGEEIWLASGPVVAVAGFRYPTRMAVMRLHDRQLFIWSPVALTPPLRAAVEALGTVRWLIAPNTLHDRFLAEWQRAYPSAALHAPAPLPSRRADLSFGASLGGADAPRWPGEIHYRVVGGNRITTEAVFFHAASRAILVADLLQQFEPGWFTGWRSLVARLDGLVGSEPRVPRKFRLAFVDRRLARDAVRAVVAWPAERLVMAHGPPMERGAQAAVRRAFGWLLPPTVGRGDA